ncbi:MAG: hypothetical protein N2689_14475, partial [Verrucomicrobiae bacterium]|nr:hypothetical protein [Verrucomicrobiae bacterium]
YDTEYYNLELAANVKPFLVGAGYEVLGSDNGVPVVVSAPESPAAKAFLAVARLLLQNAP